MPSAPVIKSSWGLDGAVRTAVAEMGGAAGNRACGWREGPPAGESGDEAITMEGRALLFQEEPLGMRTKETDLERNESLAYPSEGPSVSRGSRNWRMEGLMALGHHSWSAENCLLSWGSQTPQVIQGQVSTPLLPSLSPTMKATC